MISGMIYLLFFFFFFFNFNFFSDSAVSSWTDSLVESFEESEFENGIDIPASTAIKV